MSVLFFLDGRGLGDADSKLNLKVGNHLQLDTASYPARLESSPTLLKNLKTASINALSPNTDVKGLSSQGRTRRYVGLTGRISP
jgi:hypothetical protein